MITARIVHDGPGGVEPSPSLSLIRNPKSAIRNLGCGCLVLLISLAVAAAPRARGENVHRPDANCGICHTADRATLAANPARARLGLKENLEATCNNCHGSQGPSHKTGIRAAMRVPPELPLSGTGTIACATCHFMHGENNSFGDFLRIDNRRGKLCLSCHKLSDLK